MNKSDLPLDLESLLPAMILPARLSYSSWWGHVPFATWIVTYLNPALLVELGTHTGISYCAFCEAALVNEQNGKFYAIDTWAGDEHAGHYGDDIYEDLVADHRRYETFSTLIRKTFEESVDYFADGSIDLLHIDGFHTYEAVRGDFETWRPKLSDRAIVLFHDTQVRRDDFGVWRFWAEVSAEYPSFEFFHGHGLGVLFVGNEHPSPIADYLLTNDETRKTNIRRVFSFLGERWMTENLRQDALRHLDYTREQLEKHKAELANVQGQLGSLQSEYVGMEKHLQSQLDHQDSEVRRLLGIIDKLNQDLQHWREQATHFENLTAQFMGDKTHAEEQLAIMTKDRDHLLWEAERQQGFYDQLESAYLPLKDAYEALQPVHAELVQQHNQLCEQRDQLQSQYDQLTEQHSQLQSDQETLNEVVRGMQGSLSWRITAPLRNIKRLFKG